MNSTHPQQEAFDQRCAPEPGTDASDAAPKPQLFGSSGLVGDDVHDQHGVQLGEIREIVLNMRSGRIGYAVLACGGFLGLGERLLAIPWEALRLDADSRYLVLDVNREVLEDAPIFDRGEWARLTDEFWALAVARLAGQRGAQAAPAVHEES